MNRKIRKTCLFDSSTWISFALGIEKGNKITEKIYALLNQNVTVLIPEIIYAEVKNVLKRLNTPEFVIKKIDFFFRKKSMKKFCAKEEFWFKKLDFYNKKHKLKTHDLVILAYAVEYKVDHFLTGDQELLNTYNSLIQNPHEHKN